MASRRAPSWQSFSSTSTPQTCEPQSPDANADDLAIVHVGGDWQEVKGVLRKDMETIGEYLQTWKLKIKFWGGLLARAGVTLALVNSKAEYRAPAAAEVLTPALLILSSNTPRELWLNACVLQQQTIFHPCGHPTYWVSLGRSHTIVTVSSTPCHMERFHLLHSALTCSPRGGSDGGAIGAMVSHETYESNFIHHDFVQFGKQHSRRDCTGVRFNRLRTGVGRFGSFLHKWRMAPFTPCECGAEEQTVDRIVLHCPIHRFPHGLNVLTVLDGYQHLPEIYSAT